MLKWHLKLFCQKLFSANRRVGICLASRTSWNDDSKQTHLFHKVTIAFKNQSISNIIRWVAGLLGRSSRHLMVQSLFDRLGIKQWVDSSILLFLSYKRNKKNKKIIVRGILQKLLKYWTIRLRDHRPSKPVTQRIILEIDWFIMC